jgi:NAD(P)-dependent dehydrogenase (short-subunit alcohol dehydrogenase family)
MTVGERAVPTAADVFDLTGRVAIVTGGGTGIGAATALLLAAHAADVVIAARFNLAVLQRFTETTAGLDLLADLARGPARRWSSPATTTRCARPKPPASSTSTSPTALPASSSSTTAATAASATKARAHEALLRHLLA